MYQNIVNREDWRQKWVWGITLLTGGAVVYAARFTMPICITQIAKEFDWSKTTSGTVLSSFFWGYALTQIIGGYQADKRGGEVILVAAGVMWTLMTFWTPYFLYLLDFKNNPSLSLALFVIYRVLYGASQGMHFPATVNIISSNLHTSEKTLFTSTIFSGGSIGIIGCGFVASVILSSYSWYYVFYIVGAFSIGWVLILRVYVIEKYSKLKGAISKSNMSKARTRQEKVPWLFLLSHKQFWALILAHFFHANAWFIIFSWNPSFFHERFPTAPTWTYSSVPYFVSIFSSIIAGYVGEALIKRKLGVTFVRKFLHTVSQITVAVSLIFLPQADNLWTAVFFLCAITVGGSICHASTLVNAQDLVPELAGSVFGIMNTAGAIPGFVGVYICGYILETTGSWQLAFNLTALCSIIGLLIFISFGSGNRIELPKYKLLSETDDNIVHT
ncbi:Solute carrier family 17 member 9 [Nymphon striatum]|nr:Solute carrier family 17 member 9 [Nymphon striatum]